MSNVEPKNPYPKRSHLHFAWESGFFEGYKTSLEVNPFSEDDVLKYQTWVEESQEAADFLRNNRIEPKMDGSHVSKVFEQRKELLNLWKKLNYNNDNLETNINK